MRHGVENRAGACSARESCEQRELPRQLHDPGMSCGVRHSYFGANGDKGFLQGRTASSWAGCLRCTEKAHLILLHTDELTFRGMQRRVKAAEDDAMRLDKGPKKGFMYGADGKPDKGWTKDDPDAVDDVGRVSILVHPALKSENGEFVGDHWTQPTNPMSAEEWKRRGQLRYYNKFWKPTGEKISDIERYRTAMRLVKSGVPMEEYGCRWNEMILSDDIKGDVVGFVTKKILKGKPNAQHQAQTGACEAYRVRTNDVNLHPHPNYLLTRARHTHTS